MGVGFDGRGKYSPESRKMSIVLMVDYTADKLAFILYEKI